MFAQTGESAEAVVPRSFDVVSIRPSRPDARPSVHWRTTPDGYHAEGQSIATTILLAYYPLGMSFWNGRLVGAPGWLTSELYDIDAKVAEADITDWEKQGVQLDQKLLLREMLQSLLAERCHLAFRRVPAQLDGWRLEIAKNAPRLAESKADEELPAGVKLRGGGLLVPWARPDDVVLRFYHATMSDLAFQLSLLGGQPVADHTGLTGHYDFSLGWITDPEHPERDGIVSSEDPDPVSHWNVNALGLRVVPMKMPIDNLVIDHVERPSANWRQPLLREPFG